MSKTVELLFQAAPLCFLAASTVGCGRAVVQAAAPARVVVPVVKAAPADLANDIVLTAEFTPYQDVQLMAKVAGFVKEIRVDIGDHVREGELLATLEVPELKDETAKAQGGLDAARANILTAQGNVERAQAAAGIAHLSYGRIQEVLENNPGLVPRQDVDVAQSRDLEAKAALAGAQASLRAAEQQQAQADSELKRTQAMYGYTAIRAPFNGVVTRRYANTGSMIQAGTASATQAMPVVELAQDDLLRLTFPVPVTAAAQIRVGEPVEVRVTTLNRTFPGKVTRFADTLQTSTRTMNTEVDVPNPKGLLIPGMYAEVRLHVAAASHALSVPLDAVEGLGTTAVTAYVVRSGRVAVAQVESGVQTPTRVQITSGLQAGDAVIVGRHANLAAGQQVEPRPAGYEE